MSTVDQRADVTSRVRGQYERLPYPKRDPADEKRRLLQTSLDDLSLVNQYCFAGRKNFNTGFRALVAGGGTGDAVVYLAHQLRRTDAEIVYVDLSRASLEVAKARCAARGLDRRVTWLNGSLLDLPQMDLGRFDYVNCSGVLHHLESPEAGLAALRAVLADDGAMGLMVYGRYGRTAVYQMQELFRLAVPDAAETADAANVIRRGLTGLPATNWHVRGGGTAGVTGVDNDEELYDLYMHSRDRAYSVPELYALLASAGLNLVEFTAESRPFYEPHLVAPGWPLLSEVDHLPKPRRQAVAELLSGAIAKHTCWVSPGTGCRLPTFDADNIPFFTALGRAARAPETIPVSTGPTTIRVIFSPTCSFSIGLDVTPAGREFIGLIDGRRTVTDILYAIVGEGASKERIGVVWNECRALTASLSDLDLIAFRHASGPALPAA